MEEQKSSDVGEKVGTFVSSAVNRVLNLIMILVIIALVALVAWFWHNNELLEQKVEGLQNDVEKFEKMNLGSEDRDIVVGEKIKNSENEVNKETVIAKNNNTVSNSQPENKDAVIKNKTSQELMKELIIKEYRIKANSGDFAMDNNVSDSEIVADYKVYKEVKSPYSNKVVVLYGTIDGLECNSRPTGIFINNNGVLGENYHVQGSCNVSLGIDIKWKNDNTVLFNEVLATEGGISSTQETLNVK